MVTTYTVVNAHSYIFFYIGDIFPFSDQTGGPGKRTSEDVPCQGGLSVIPNSCAAETILLPVCDV